jgi:hypothetical protein
VRPGRVRPRHARRPTGPLTPRRHRGGRAAADRPVPAHQHRRPDRPRRAAALRLPLLLRRLLPRPGPRTRPAHPVHADPATATSGCSGPRFAPSGPPPCCANA